MLSQISSQIFLERYFDPIILMNFLKWKKKLLYNSLSDKLSDFPDIFVNYFEYLHMFGFFSFKA